MSEPTLVVPVADVLREPREFLAAFQALLSEGARVLTWFGGPCDVPGEVALTAVVEQAGGLRVLRTQLDPSRGFHSQTVAHPALHVFERELHEEWGVTVHGHPWLKPVRFPEGLAAGVAGFPYYQLMGKGVHEVAVGPVHAGVIEPGHFRFQCHGEDVHHLEIQLGYQHRGLEGLLVRQPLAQLGVLVETAAGDTSVANAWASAAALEALRGVTVEPDVERLRGIGLELERVAMHLSGLSGMATDVAFLQGASTYGRLRTTAINTQMLLCGSRFGRGFLRVARRGVSGETLAAVRRNVALLVHDLAIIHPRFLGSYTVQHRLQGVGVVSRATALELGLVGQAARASGLALDTRAAFPGALYTRLPMALVVEESGDCWARAHLRVRELTESLRWLSHALEGPGIAPVPDASAAALPPGRLAVSVREGFRGEVVHVLETDDRGALRRYRLQDPSLRNWFGLAMALRGNDISDFPICNKSFDLSYCGHDL